MYSLLTGKALCTTLSGRLVIPPTLPGFPCRLLLVTAGSIHVWSEEWPTKTQRLVAEGQSYVDPTAGLAMFQPKDGPKVILDWVSGLYAECPVVAPGTDLTVMATFRHSVLLRLVTRLRDDLLRDEWVLLPLSRASAIVAPGAESFLHPHAKSRVILSQLLPLNYPTRIRLDVGAQDPVLCMSEMTPQQLWMFA